MTKAELINELAKVKGDLHFLMRANIWDISTGEVKEGFDTFLKNGYNIDCDAPDALDKIKNYKKTKRAKPENIKGKIEQILKENEGKKNYIGIRGTTEPLNIGDILDTSYDWDCENDRPSNTKLGGVCCINMTDDDWYYGYVDSNEKREQILNFATARAEYAIKNYSYPHWYIIISNNHNPENKTENDKYEIILANAKVVATL
ncbi:MAG: hypothetical protein PHI40_08045 [Caldisericia bacterium]|nr:hypothetical protein [Caldisericia bacterium]